MGIVDTALQQLLGYGVMGIFLVILIAACVRLGAWMKECWDGRREDALAAQETVKSNTTALEQLSDRLEVIDRTISAVGEAMRAQTEVIRNQSESIRINGIKLDAMRGYKASED